MNLCLSVSAETVEKWLKRKNKKSEKSKTSFRLSAGFSLFHGDKKSVYHLTKNAKSKNVDKY